MRATGLIRKIGSRRLFNLPKEIRDELSIYSGDHVSISLESDMIVIEKIVDQCYICENEKNLIKFKDKNICMICIEEIVNNSEKGVK